VTMTILWEEFREANPDGHGYSRFCDLLRGFPPWPTPSSTASFITPIASISSARACASGSPRPEINVHAKGPARPAARRPWKTAGSSLRSNGERASHAVTHRHSSFCGDPNPSPLDPRLPAKHHRTDPRKQTPGGRNQIGIPAGFRSESVAAFVGNRSS
jgi:hypothetical protein